MEVRLGRFAEAFPGEIGDVGGPQIDAYLRGLRSRAKTKKGQPIAGKTRNNHRNAIVELFNYAKKNGYLPKDLGTEAASTTRVKEIKKDNETTAIAVPYHAGMHPYEQVAFQWSCHRLDSPDSQLAHAEWINLTVWSEGERVPKYHADFARFRGLAYFDSDALAQKVARSARTSSVSFPS
jgi:hypothetical protein